MTRIPKIGFVQILVLSFAFLALFVFLPQSLLGQELAAWESGEPFTAAPKEVIKSASDSEDGINADNNRGILLLFKHIKLNYEADGTANRTEHLVYKVLDRDSVENASVIDESWSPWFEKSPVIEARVISPRGTVTELNPETLTEAAARQLEGGVLSDDKRVQGVLPNLRVGSIVERLTTFQEKESFCEHGSLFRTTTGRLAGLKHWKFTVTAPEELSLKFKVRGADFSPKVSTTGGVKTWHFEQKNKGVPKGTWRNQSPDHVFVPMVDFTTGKSWNEIAKFYSQHVEDQIKSSDVTEFVKEIAKADGLSRKEKIERVVSILDDRIRYTGFEFGKSAFIPNTPEKTWSRGLGDCKDEATLMVAMLRELGIESYVALLNRGVLSDLDASLPALNAFNHVIVYVPGASPIWIDTTSEFYDIGYLPFDDQQRWALIADERTQALVRTPKHDSSKNVKATQFDIDVFEYEDYLANAKIKDIESGRFAALKRYRMSSAPKRQIFQELKESLAAENSLNARGFEFSDPYDLSKPFELSIEYSNPSGVGITDDEAIYSFDISQTLALLPRELFLETGAEETGSALRETPFVFEEYFQVKKTHRIKFPIGYELDSLPDSISIEVDQFKFSVKPHKVNDREMRVTCHLDTGSSELSLENYSILKTKLATLLSEDESSRKVTVKAFNRVNRLAAKGQFTDAIVELEKLEKAEPNQIAHKLRRSNLLLHMGLGVAARENARGTVKSFPENALAHRLCGAILSLNQIGTPAGRGFDRAAAIKEFGLASKLAPGDGRYPWEQAILYTVDSRGYGIVTEEDVKKANELFALATKDENLTFSDPAFRRFLLSLLAAKNLETLETALKNNEVDASTFPFHLALAGLKYGKEGVEKKLRQYRTNSEQRDLYLGQTVDMLKAVQEYGLALEVGSLVSPALKSQTEVTVETIELLSKVDSSKRIESGDPRYPLWGLSNWASMDGVDHSKVQGFFSSRASIEDIKSFTKAAAISSHSRLSRMPIATTEFLNDANMLNMSELRVEGRNWLVSPSGARSLVRFEDGVAKLVPTTRYGDFALELLDNGDAKSLQLARSILDDEFRFSMRIRQRSNRNSATDPFSVYYKEGKDPSIEQLRLTAAYLASSSNQAAVKLLEARLEEEPNERLVLSRILFAKYLDNKERRTIELAKYLSNEMGSDLLTAVYIALEMYDEAMDSVHIEYSRPASKQATYSLLATIEARRLNLEESKKYIKKFVEERGDRESHAMLLNSYAWATLFVPSATDGLEKAKKAAELVPGETASLHTLATVQAANGQLAAARNSLVRAISVRPLKEFEVDDELVLGRIAQEVGLIDDARNYYKRCAAANTDRQREAADLAILWLKELDKATSPQLLEEKKSEQ